MFTKFYLISSLLIGISAASASDSGFTTSSDSDSGDEGSRKRTHLSFHETQTAMSSLRDELLSNTTVIHKGKITDNKVKYKVNNDFVIITEANPAYTARHTFKRVKHTEGYGITAYFKKLKTN